MSTPAIPSVRSRIDAAPPYVLALFRIVTGLLFACHGAAGLFGLFGGPPGGRAAAPGEWPGWWAALIQLVGGLLVLAGFGTRVAALLCSGSMAYAYFTVHAGHDLLPMRNGGEPSVLYCWSFLLIAAFGSGAWSLRGLVAGRRATGSAEAPSPTRRAATADAPTPTTRAGAADTPSPTTRAATADAR